MATTARWTATGNLSSNGTTGMAPTLTAAANDVTGAGANNALVFTAGASGSRIMGLMFKANGTNVATVARIFINNGSANTTPANNSYFDDQSLPASTVSATAAMTSIPYWFPGGYLDIEASWRIYVGLGTAVAAGWTVTPIMAGDF